ncbi:sulfate reduction electron transfer complex DsrMKJOP subunit DsrJ [Bacteroidota bacterium]
MYDSGKILFGLIIFIGLFTSPIWYDLESEESDIKPNIILPADENIKECVASTEYMRSSHMDLLNEWRDLVVREEKRIYKSPTGKEFEMSLSNTCTNCHSNKSQFCDRCHEYLNVTPYCWDCHVEPPQMEIE